MVPILTAMHRYLGESDWVTKRQRETFKSVLGLQPARSISTERSLGLEKLPVQEDRAVFRLRRGWHDLAGPQFRAVRTRGGVAGRVGSARGEAKRMISRLTLPLILGEDLIMN